MKMILKIVLSLVLILVLAEAGLRFTLAFAPAIFIGNESGKGFKAKAQRLFVQDKINKLWAREASERETILEPPFQVFVNKGFHDQERLDFIFKHAALPANHKVTAPNFLRLNQSASPFTFTVTTNKLRFRGTERPVTKATGTFRIIVLGSYPAFGHGANDDETYAHILEQELSQRWKRKVEVWNGGRQGGTSIMGYTRLTKEIERYSPDLILWDYGWIELYLGRDRIMHPKFQSHVSLNPFGKALRAVCVKSRLSYLKLCSFSVRKMNKVNYSDSIAGWKESMELVKKWANDRKLPVLFLRHLGVTIPSREYEQFDASNSYFRFLDTTPAVSGPPDEKEVAIFWQTENWLSEIGVTQREVMTQEPGLVYFGDAIQYNKLGYQRIGTYIAEKLGEKFPEFTKGGRKASP